MLGWIVLLFHFATATAGTLQLPVVCQELLRPPPIGRTTTDLFPNEMKVAGEILKPGQNFSKIHTGFYIYLITDTGEILWSPTYNIEEYLASGRGIATHKALLAMYELITGHSAEGRIVAAGEVQMAFGRVVRIRNKSGNFRAGSQTLQWAVQTFAERGLKFESSSVIQPLNPFYAEEMGHTPADRKIDDYRLETLAHLYADPRGSQLIELFERFGALLIELYPELGGPDRNMELTRGVLEGARISRDLRGQMNFMYPMHNAYNVDGFVWAIWGVQRGLKAGRLGPKEDFSVSLPAQLANFLLAKGSHLTLSQVVAVHKIANDFKALAP